MCNLHLVLYMSSDHNKCAASSDSIEQQDDTAPSQRGTLHVSPVGEFSNGGLEAMVGNLDMYQAGKEAKRRFLYAQDAWIRATSMVHHLRKGCMGPFFAYACDPHQYVMKHGRKEFTKEMVLEAFLDSRDFPLPMAHNGCKRCGGANVCIYDEIRKTRQFQNFAEDMDSKGLPWLLHAEKAKRTSESLNHHSSEVFDEVAIKEGSDIFQWLCCNNVVFQPLTCQHLMEFDNAILCGQALCDQVRSLTVNPLSDFIEPCRILKTRLDRVLHLVAEKNEGSYLEHALVTRYNRFSESVTQAWVNHPSFERDAHITAGLVSFYSGAFAEAHVNFTAAALSKDHITLHFLRTMAQYGHQETVKKCCCYHLEQVQEVLDFVPQFLPPEDLVKFETALIKLGLL